MGRVTDYQSCSVSIDTDTSAAVEAFGVWPSINTTSSGYTGRFAIRGCVVRVDPLPCPPAYWVAVPQKRSGYANPYTYNSLSAPSSSSVHIPIVLFPFSRQLLTRRLISNNTSTLSDAVA